jgi:hypothetical protein
MGGQESIADRVGLASVLQRVDALMAMVARQEARLASVQSDVEELKEDDFPESPFIGGTGGGSGTWSGYYWWGGKLFGGPSLLSNLQGQYFGVEIRTGDENWLDVDDEDFDEMIFSPSIEWRYVANKTIENPGTEDEKVVYTLSSRSVGDLVFRII